MKYTPPLGGGANDSYVTGNKAAGIQGSNVNGAALEEPQRELIAIISAAAGLNPSDGDLAQALKALKQLFGGNLTTLTATGPLLVSQAGLVLIDATAGDVVVTLPAANLQPMIKFAFIRIDATGHAATVQAAGADAIDQGTNFTLPSQNASRAIVGDGVGVWRTSAQQQSSAAGIGVASGPLLTYVDATHVKLLGRNGSTPRVGGALISLGAGVTGTNAGVMVNGVPASNLAANTDYLVSLYDPAGVATIGYWALPTYSYMADTTAGNIGTPVISTGGAPITGHSLVGIVGTNGASQFSAMMTRSYFSRAPANASAGTSASTASNTLVELSTSFRVMFVCFADDQPLLIANGWSQLSNTSETDVLLSLDGGTVSPDEKVNFGSPFTGMPFSCLYVATVADGRHTASLFGSVGTSGTASFNGGVQVALGK